MNRFPLSLALVMALGTPAFAQELRAPADFDNIQDKTERSVALFEEMGKVITSPRCLNCHPKGGPTQGDDMHPHEPPVVRGDADFGAAGMTCNTCHGPANFKTTDVGGIESIPGHDPWALAPVEMAWADMSLPDICNQIKDPERNGDRSLEDLHEHMAEDGLVGWAWHPGEGRTPAPGSQEVFGQLTLAWIDTGAACPG